MVRICFAFSLERKIETERWFSLCCPVDMGAQEVMSDDEAGGKDKNWSESTLKPFSGIMAAVTLCFATGHVSFSAISQALHC